MEFYRQTSVYTGAPAALLMALHYKDSQSWPLDREKEFSIWIQSANLPTRSSSVYALGLIAQKAGYETRVVVGEKEYDYPDYRFQRYKKVEVQDAKFASRLYAKKAREAGVKIEEREFGVREVQKAVEEASFVILRVNAGVFREKKATSKYVLVYAYDADSDTYSIMDPMQGDITIEGSTLTDAFETLLTKKKRDHRMIILH